MAQRPPGNPPSLNRIKGVRFGKTWVLSYQETQAELSLGWGRSQIVFFVMHTRIWLHTRTYGS